MKDKNGLTPYDIAKQSNSATIAAFQKYFEGSADRYRVCPQDQLCPVRQKVGHRILQDPV